MAALPASCLTGATLVTLANMNDDTATPAGRPLAPAPDIAPPAMDGDRRVHLAMIIGLLAAGIGLMSMVTGLDPAALATAALTWFANTFAAILAALGHLVGAALGIGA